MSKKQEILLTRKTTVRVESGWALWNYCKKKKKAASRRGTAYKIFGDMKTMGKVDLHARNEIIDEAVEKDCHSIFLDETGQEYIFEDYASRIYKNIRKIYDVKDEDLYK
jgi:ribosomal protein S3AE